MYSLNFAAVFPLLINVFSVSERYLISVLWKLDRKLVATLLGGPPIYLVTQLNFFVKGQDNINVGDQSFSYFVVKYRLRSIFSRFQSEILF